MQDEIVFDLATAPYSEVLEWAGADFGRLVAIAKARDYRPEWLVRKLEEFSIEPTPHQAAILSRMIDEAGPFLSRRQRWIVRKVKAGPLYESELVTEAIHAYEYRDYKHADRAVAHDLRKLIELGRIKMSVGGCVSLVDADTVAVAARAQHQRSDGPGITGDVA